MTHLKYSVKKLGRTFEPEKEVLKTEMNHDEINQLEKIGYKEKTM